jgi:two-component system phosphate regulon sensor histidine kinase PhoR
VADDEAQLELAERLGVGMLLVGTNGRISAANKSAHRLLGTRPGSLPGKTTMEAFVDHRIDGLIRGAPTDSDAQAEIVTTSEPAQTVIVRARRSSDGSVAVLLEDVSELRRLRRIRTEFVDNLSHELRTPLTTMRLLTESLGMEIDRTEVTPRIREYVAKIDDETGHLVQMVSELLDLAQIEQGEAPLRVREVDLARVAKATLERLRPYAERQGVELRMELPELGVDRTVGGDEERLAQLLVNLVHNAIKFSPSGTAVAVRIKPLETEILLEVEDHGAGIPRRDLGRIFERFYKVDRARADRIGGTGLGLAIARHIVERHGGRIWVESQEGQGSRFSVALPRAS